MDPVTQEAIDVKGLQSEVSPGKTMKSYLKNN
jgi:hypothetical protein